MLFSLTPRSGACISCQFCLVFWHDRCILCGILGPPQPFQAISVPILTVASMSVILSKLIAVKIRREDLFMKYFRLLYIVFFLLIVITPTMGEEDHYARGIVIQALEPNNLGVGGAEFKTKPNPKGKGVFVYDPRTRFHGVQRFLVWLVLNDVAYPLNGPSKNLTPSLKWPREASKAEWKKTGLDPYLATESIRIVFSQ